MNNHLPYQGCVRSLTKTGLTLIWGFLFLLGFSANLTAQDCCDQGDKVKSLTMRYTGESCSATNTSQASDKYDCSGNPNSDPSVYIVVSEKENGSGKIYFTGNVALNQTFTATAANANTNEFKAKTFFRIFSSQGGSLLQLVEIHTSCSAPIVTGEQVGSMRIESVIFKNNFNCGPPPDPCTATFTNEGTQVGRLWQFFGNNQWSSTYTTIQPGATVTKNVGDGQVWQIWNVADNQMFAAFTIDCDEDNDYCFTQSGPTSCTPPEVCPAPVINAPNQQICRGEAVTFTAPDLGFPCLDYTWNFGSNATPSTATGKGPISVVFSSTGNVNVSLSIDNDCNNTTPPNPPVVFGCCNQDERGEHDHPHQLILEYVGGGSTNVIFRATDNGPFTFFSGQVSTGDIFVVDGTGHTDKHGELNRLDTDTEFKIGNSSYKEVHTSCSQDISPGYGINSNGDLIQNGTSSNSVFIVRGIVMLNTGSGSSIYCEEGITDPNGGGGGNPANGTTVCGSDCFDCEKTTTVTVTVVECDPCVGQGGDSDGDGVCNNQDCAPNNPNLPTTPGTACNDGNPNTGNDIIQADGCTCAGTPLQVDLELTKSVNKSIVEPGETAQWTISVVNKGPAIATNVTVLDNFPAGLTYNSANASQGSFNAGTLTWNIGNLAVNQTVTLTINTTVTAISGTIRNFAQIQTANPNDIDSTPGNDNNQTPNEDDEDDATITVQPCINQGGDTDGDGVCNNQDCAPNNPNLPTTPGTACNDGNPNTGNDIIQADGCTCTGTPLVCNLNATFMVANGCLEDAFLLFADANDPYVPPTNPLYTYSYDIQPQSSVAGLFTTDPRSINVTFNSPGVKTVTATITNPAIPNCQIIKVATFNVEDCSDPCINQGGDSDNDGICDNDDCAPTNPNLPTTPGTACNDGNPNTSNDVIQEDGCSCAGTPVGGPDCEEDIDITVGNGKITVTGLEGAPVSSLQIFNASWQQEFTCFANCSATEMISVAPGTYYVYAKYYTASYGLICEKQATVTVTGGCPDADNDGTCDVDDCLPNDPFYPTAPGTPCNDGNPNTTNDVVTANGCGCQGTPAGCPDADNDGTCDVDDCQPNNPFYPTTPGTPCNDGNPNTTNDVVTANGCGCQGTPVGTPNCEEDIDITTDNGTIIVSGLGGAPVSSIQVFTATWQPVFSCFANCNGTETINVPAGTYLVYAKYYTAGYQLICEKQATVTVGGGGPCTNVTNGGTIGFGNSCAGATDYCPNQGPAPTVKNCVAPSGGAGNLEIVWLKSTTSCDYPTTTADEIAQGLDPHWTMIPGATGLDYSPGNVTQQTCFLRCARRAGCPNFIESNIVTLGISGNCGGGGGGGTPDCANIGINTGLGTITVTGLDGAPVTSVQIFSAAWQPEHNCFANCQSPTATFSVTAGAHYVYVKYYTAQYQLICEVNQTVNVPIALGASQSQNFQFEAVKHLEHTELLWVHQGDYFVSTYALERSADGIGFEEIYNVPSEQDASADVYEGYDLEPLTGLNHYRVKMLNLDGTVSYSKVKTVEFEDRIDFVLFPNPANEFTNINLESIVGFKGVDIHIYNNAGVRMKQFHLDEVWSKYYQMDLRDLHEGHYAVWVNIPGRRSRTVQLVIGRL